MANNTIFAAYNLTKSRLSAAGIEDFGFEARVIMRHITGFDNKKIMLNYNTPLTPGESRRLDDIVNRRIARYPLQYILGEWSFYGLDFKVGEGVLIPRADSETAVETALELIKDIKAPKVLDLCAGSGAIGISVAANRPDSSVLLLEKSEEAAKYLKENIMRNSPDNARYVSGDVFAGDGAGEYDLIISNPPYVRTKDLKRLQPEVLFEPAAALDGGEDGLDFYNAITKNYKKSLKIGGYLCFEVGINQAKSVAGILDSAGFDGIGVRKDLNGIDRVVFGTVG
ncbi:MAG: peptide chain release factor N(5)-glutamine methyltransferase [Clostridia bacterium]|nr:peptide chain release factor N(5)-glutamine methyltransferase [Clostridia bacterium]